MSNIFKKISNLEDLFKITKYQNFDIINKEYTANGILQFALLQLDDMSIHLVDITSDVVRNYLEIKFL